MVIETARVLLAEPDQELRSKLYKAFMDREVPCDCVADGISAVERLRDYPYTVLIIDLALERVEAARVLEFVAAIRPSQRPIVVATVTGLAREDVDPDIVQILIRKPLRFPYVVDMIAACIQNASQWRGSAGPDGRARQDLRRD